jgi:hypothetical protein
MQRLSDERAARDSGEAVGGAGDSGADESDDPPLVSGGAAAAAAVPLASTAPSPSAASSSVPHVGQAPARAREGEQNEDSGALEEAREQEQRQAWRRTMAELEAAERGGSL